MARLAALQQALTTPQAMQQTRQARRLYVSSLPVTASEASLLAFFNYTMMAAGACTALGQPAIGLFLSPDKRFAFVEFRTVEEAANAMAFDGVMCQGEALRIRRPHDYNLSAVAHMGPSEPSPHINVSLLSALGGLVDEALSTRISVSGLPATLSEEQVQSVISSFGPLTAFTLVRDPAGGPANTAFAEFADFAMLGAAIAGLSAMEIGGQKLTAVRAVNPQNALALQQLITHQQTALMHRLTGRAPPLPPAAPPAAAAAAMAPPAGGFPPPPPPGGFPAPPPDPAAAPAAAPSAAPAAAAAAAPAPRVVRLAAMVTREELLDGEEYDDILEDTRTEVAKYGPLRRVVVPRPSREGGPAADPPGVGLVFLEYEDGAAAERARLALHGRAFGGRHVEAAFFDECKFAAEEYE